MREIKFKFYDTVLNKMIDRKPRHGDFDHKDIIPLQFTGKHDKNLKEIHDGDVISDVTQTDEGFIKSKCQVFWNDFTASYHVDQSFKQDKTCSTELWQELNDFKYEVIGNIHEQSLI